MSHHVWHVWQTQNKFLSRLHLSLFWWQEGESLNFWILFAVLKRTQSVLLPSGLLPSVFCLFFCTLQSYPCSFELMRLASCWWWGCWTQVLDSLGNDSQTSWWQNRHFHHSSQRRGQTNIPHAYRQILFLSCCSRCWDYDLSESSSPQQPQQQQQSPDQSPSQATPVSCKYLNTAGMGLHQLEDFQWAQ